MKNLNLITKNNSDYNISDSRKLTWNEMINVKGGNKTGVIPDGVV